MGIKGLPAEALTLDQYRRLDLARPYTDEPIGWHTSPKRADSAAKSALHDGPPTLCGVTAPARKAVNL